MRALATHDMIEQIPRSVYVVSLDRTRTIGTAIGAFSIHRLAPELFTGFDGTPDTAYVATPEKALFDSVYVRAPRGGRPYFPELALPPSFDASKLDRWLSRVTRPQLRTMVRRGLDSALRETTTSRTSPS